MADENKLELILTQYGLDRVTGAIPGPETLSLTKIRIGSGDNNKYYEPDVTQEELKGDLGYEFYVYDKQLLEDGLTVSFHTIFPEDVSGFDIREVGLYEVIGNEEHLFAIATQQPIVKPAVKYNYFIKVDYYIFLRNQNLADSYDRITLDVEHAQVSEADLESLLRSFLFAQENLMLQIGKNSEVIGYNRPSQIMEKVSENKQNYSYITLYKNFASVLDLVSSPNNVLAYWAFDYSRRETLGNSITDLSNNREYLNTSITLSALPHVYRGFQSMFTFKGSNSYYLPSNKPINLYDTEKRQDKPFTMVFSVEPNENSFNKTRTLLAKSDRATGAVVFEVQELDTKALQVRLYSDKDNYITFKTSDNVIPRTAHSIVLTYDPENLQVLAFINSKEYNLLATETRSYTHINTEAAGSLYKYFCNPVYTTYAGYNVEGSSTKRSDYIICDSQTGEPLQNTNGWTAGRDVRYKGNIAEVDTEVPPIELHLYAHYPQSQASQSQSPPTVYTDVETLTGPDNLYNDNFTLYEGDAFEIIEEGGQYKVVFDPSGSAEETVMDSSRDITRTIQKFKYVPSPAEQAIYTVTDNLQRSDYPLYTVTFNENQEVVSYNIYTGHDWTLEENPVVPGNYNLVYDKNYRTEGGSDGWIGQLDPVPLQVNGTPLASYIIDTNGSIIDNVNSSVGIVSILDEKLEPTEARILALNLCATLGMNPFLTGE